MSDEVVRELEAEGNTQGSMRQRETRKAAGGRGKHARQHEAEGNTQGSMRQRETRKAA